MRKVGSLHGCVGCTSKCVARSGVLRETIVAKLNFDLSMNFTGERELAGILFRCTRISAKCYVKDEENRTNVDKQLHLRASEFR